MNERKVFSWDEDKEADHYWGKAGVFSNDLGDLLSGKGHPSVLYSVWNGDLFPFVSIAGGHYRFFSPDQEHV